VIPSCQPPDRKQEKAGWRERNFKNDTHFLSHAGANAPKMPYYFFFACFDALVK